MTESMEDSMNQPDAGSRGLRPLAGESPERGRGALSLAAGGVGRRLRELFGEAERERREIEERWLQDLRQYKGVYDPETTARLHPRRSKAFLRLTRNRVRAVDARLMDLLFPGNGEKNWSIDPTPVPQIDVLRQAELLEELRDRLGREPAEAEARAAVREKSQDACEAMTREIADQLAECRYREVIRDVIHSGDLFGTGVLKGPLVERRLTPRWERDDAGWTLSERQELRPYVEFVPLWDIYPDMAARSMDEARYVFQRHVMSKYELMRLAARPDFDGAAILELLQESPEGDAKTKGFENQLRAMGGGDAAASPGRRRYEVLEYWGFADGRDLAACGVELPEEGLEHEHPAVIWLVGDAVVKASLSPLEGVSRPYFFYHFDKDETGVFGEGLASVMRDPQGLFNASVRALLDNAAISAGPQIEVNLDLLPEDEDPTDIHPFRVWLRSGLGAEAQSPAVRVFTLPSHADQFMAMAEMFARYAQETASVPGLSGGEADAGAMRTAQGASMLMAAASVTLKDQVRGFDDGVTRPFLTAMYHWNMQFNPKEEVKGDYAVRARGWSSLVAREIYVEQLDRFASSVLNDLDAPYVNRAELLRRRAEARELGEGIIKTEAEVRAATALAEARKAR